MNISKQIRRLNSNEKLVHQGYDMPWPITDRDFVMNQTAKYNSETKEFTLQFKSVEAEDMPVQKCCVRAMAYRTFWYLKNNSDGTTKVIVEVYADPKGSLPPWLINMIQKDWPYNTITGLLKFAKNNKVIPDAKISGW